MNIIEVVQGSDEWKAVRAKHFCASEAAAMLGCSKFMSRSELLKQKYTGIVPEVDANKQRIFDAGHASEAAARPVVEARLSDELYPVTCTLDVEAMPLLASLDGINLSGERIWENKLYNASLETAIIEGELSDHYWPQLEQGLLVSGADTCYFTTSDGTEKATIGMWYDSISERRAQLIAGWRQFSYDLANYQHIEHIPAAVAAPTRDLPALSIQVQGSISLIDNLAVFGERLKTFVAEIDMNPSDDQGFANAEAAVKTLQNAQDALESAEASALAQTSSIDEMRKTVKLYADTARTTRLMLEKMVKARKESIRIEIMQGGKDALTEHVATLNKRLGRAYMPVIAADFAGAIKGKKTIASLRDAADTELARCKIEANAQADKIEINLNTLRELAKDHAFLFADTGSLVMKADDDLIALIKVRITEHQAAEAAKMEAERVRIQAQEEAKAKAAQDALLAAERAKMEADVRAKVEAEAAAKLAEENALIESLPAKAVQAPTGGQPQEVAVIATQRKRPSRTEAIYMLSNACGVSLETIQEWLADGWLNEFKQIERAA